MKSTIHPIRWFYAALGLFGIALFFQVASNRFLFADGVAFFLQVLTQQDFSHWDFPRQFAHHLTQWPAILAMRLGLKDVQALAYLYGAGLFCVPLVTLASCAWMTPAWSLWYLLFPTFGFAYLSLNSALFVISESHIAMGCFWVVFFSVFFLPRSAWQAAAAGIVSLFATRLYESFSILGLFLTALAVQRLWQARFQLPVWRRLQLGWVAGCGLISSGIGTYWMLFSPDRNVEKVGLGKILVELALDPNTLMSSAIAAVFVGLFVLHVEGVVSRLGLLLALVAGTLLGLLPLLDGRFLPITLHYPARVLNIALPLAFGLLMLWLEQQRRTAAPGLIWVPLTLMLAWNTSWQVAVSGAWCHYTRGVDAALADGRGLMDLRGTRVADEPFNWDWTLPSLSIVLQALEGPEVHAIIKASRPGWQPFDPNAPSDLPDLHAFGVRYRW
ncbi:MAG TPA: hypothetical protein VFH51_02695 [Myxococcota bacterium]|nr:hypothetical protein [Myxococcota bacterium]